MEVIFFDYYHPYAGLCNQLYLLTNHIHNALKLNKVIYIHKFNINIFKKNRVPIDFIFDINQTNINFQKNFGVKLLETRQPDLIENIPRLCIYPVSSIEILACLEFNKIFLEDVILIKKIISPFYYGIHFRLDIDAILHYTYPKEVYNKFMDLVNINEHDAKIYFESLDKKPINLYCEFLMQQYMNAILKFGFDKKWYICTNKVIYKIHDYFEIYLKRLIDFILQNGGEYYLKSKNYDDRELNALVDLLVLRDSEKLIGFEGSSFSEGYCYKVNQIRKVTKEFFFVKEKSL